MSAPLSASASAPKSKNRRLALWIGIAIGGFVLVAGCLVLALSGLVGGAAAGELEDARNQAALAGAERLRQAVVIYQVSEGEGCPSPDDLVRAGLLSRLEPDPWGHPYAIECRAGVSSVRSAGPDGLAGNADDVVAQN